MSDEIIRYRPELKDAVVELQTHHWSPDRAINRAYLEWKYERNPRLPGGLIHLALSDGQVVGMRGMSGALWTAGDGGETFLALCAGDTVILAEQRNRGLLGKIMKAASDDLVREGRRFAMNLSAGLATQLSALASGWHAVGEVDIATRRVGTLPASPPPLEGFDPFALFDEQLAQDGSAQVSTSREARPAAMARLIERIGSDGRIRQVRDAAYFEWRFGNPLARYRFLFWERAELDGYLIVQGYARRPGMPLTIVDWEAATDEAGAGLLDAAVRWGAPSVLRVWPASHSAEMKALLLKAGFIVPKAQLSVGSAYRSRTSRQRLLVCAARSDSEEDWIVGGQRLLDLDAWDLRGIYSDGF